MDQISHPVDRYVGAKLRAIRKARGISQGALADRLGISFQQIQKYERGVNRISASKLYETAEALAAPICAFFETLPSTAACCAEVVPDGSALQEVNKRMATMSSDKQEQVRLLVRILDQ